MRSVNIREARRQLGKLVDAAEDGQSVLITRRGKSVARIDPVSPGPGEPLPDISAFRQSIRESMQGKDVSLSAAVIEGRKQERF